MDESDEPPADRIKRYRELAHQAEDDALCARNMKSRAHFLSLANRWRQLADELENE